MDWKKMYKGPNSPDVLSVKHTKTLHSFILFAFFEVLTAW